MTLIEHLGKVGVDANGDFLQEGARLLPQMATELEVIRKSGRQARAIRGSYGHASCIHFL
jgi:hypothetical protein